MHHRAHKIALLRVINNSGRLKTHTRFNNIDNFYNVPAFHKDYKYIRTIGVSVFNKKESTDAHFGPLRTTLRVLYNINDITSRDSYIKVRDLRNNH
jgi:beta-hydroxylase